MYVLVLLEEGFQLPVSCQCGGMTWDEGLREFAELIFAPTWGCSTIEIIQLSLEVQTERHIAVFWGHSSVGGGGLVVKEMRHVNGGDCLGAAHRGEEWRLWGGGGTVGTQVCICRRWRTYGAWWLRFNIRPGRTNTSTCRSTLLENVEVILQMYFSNSFNNWYLKHFQWNLSWESVTEPH